MRYNSRYHYAMLFLQDTFKYHELENINVEYFINADIDSKEVE